jgi:hypothetical protein
MENCKNDKKNNGNDKNKNGNLQIFVKIIKKNHKKMAQNHQKS